MTNRRNAVLFAALVASGPAALAFARPANAQTYGADELPPPPPPDQDEGQAAVPPADALPPAQAPDAYSFEQGLSPYGQWVDTPEYGRVWVPSNVGPDWQPYTDGRWVDTEWGWSFASTVPWGWATYHYGRWGFGLGVGWFWVPGFAWAPAWVSWRYSPGFVCWTPYAPAGFVFARHWPGWVVVAGTHFTSPIGRFRVSPARSAPIVRAASPVAAIASRHAQGTFRAGGNGSWGRGNARPVTGGSGVRAGAPSPNVSHNVKGFQRSTFRSSGSFRGPASFASNRTFASHGASRSFSPAPGRSFAAPMRSGVAAPHGFARRR
jgi:hypothetical protein